jgi:hypothetical protein
MALVAPEPFALIFSARPCFTGASIVRAREDGQKPGFGWPLAEGG